jgi:vitamin B12 transporter
MPESFRRLVGRLIGQTLFGRTLLGRMLVRHLLFAAVIIGGMVISLPQAQASVHQEAASYDALPTTSSIVGSGPAATHTSNVVQGQITDYTGAPVPYANVLIVGTIAGAASDEDGRYRFSTTETGVQTLQVSALGYRTASRQIDLDASNTLTVDIKLRGEVVELSGATVSASSYSIGESQSVSLSTLDVVTTPGTSADIFRTVQTFPGVASVDGGSSFFVRGGDVEETVTLLDQATVAHPYRYESPTTSTFGTVPPFLVDGVNFSTGGFSAKYGNALSGVLAMDSKGMPERARYYTNLSLAATSVGVDLPIVDDKLGVRFSGNQSFTGMLFRLNGTTNTFSETPRSNDTNLSLIYNYSDSGQIKLFNYRSTNSMGVQVESPSELDTYRTSSTNWLHNLQWADSFGDWDVTTSLSMNRFTAQQAFGTIDLRPGDDIYKLRTDLTYQLVPGIDLHTGGEAQRTVSIFKGTLPESVVGGSAATFDERFAVTRSGGYAEIESQLMTRLTGRIGARADYHSASGAFTADPRLSLRYLLTEKTDAYVSWGIFHQFAAPSNYNTTTGNPNLQPQRAQHYIAGLMHDRGSILTRVEAYYKPYSNLVLGDPDDTNGTSDTALTNDGDGWSRGVDAFLKYGQFLKTRFYGRASYSFLQSNRRQTRRLEGGRRVYERGPSPFDITHNVSAVANATLFNDLSGGVLSAGVTVRSASGRPQTPIVGGEPINNGAFYQPIEGPVGSEHLPAFQRLDTQLNYYLPFGDDHSIVFYVSVNNVFGRANVLGYQYDRTYTDRTAQIATLQRSVYFGVNLNLRP